MDALRQQLFCHKTLPYISKKAVNDAMCNYILSQMPKMFYSEVYDCVERILHRQKCIVKGGAAIAAHLQDDNISFVDLDMEICIDNNSTNDNSAHVDYYDPLTMLDEPITAIVMKYKNVFTRLVSELSFDKLMCVSSIKNLIMFKSYVDEAVEFVWPANVKFALNAKNLVKVTTSNVDDKFLLTRYSVNVHALNYYDDMWIHRSDNIAKSLKFFPFDLYFLDISVRHKPYPDVLYKNLFDHTNKFVRVECVQTIIAEQLSCILYNIFNRDANKLKCRIERIRNLLGTNEIYVSPRHEAKHYQHSNYTGKYSIRDVALLLQDLGLKYGPPTIVKLYFAKRFVNNIADVTHQINFPYHCWDKRYFSNSWLHYCHILNDLFNLNLPVAKYSTLKIKN
ncbi:hypothetical protein [Ectropis obliqua nucleopolyhedrovirus]|uniref:Ac18 n=1 Tax=Ectropis obliqua nucleopolyhedrovirus TaxID=59376 RepID=A0EYZ5_9ABAC|nr:hypothetical protein EONV_gp092 [Ectropis obliqua nucleopolyhedrovirus]ABI35775.1 hypothetical protein [Ectropis obliqua nucleopolyhedrovirus]AGS47940.1 hypothetical protein wdlz-06GM101 [Ectropis obliqua nucleopolyhedrovirus]QWV59640.1 hypothetical protein EONV_gp092 [Ectropis obliqua nucleopolyhedrovirus]UYO72889.1 hypothetical protein EONV-gp092 [Ectropis obliqua nucleopolyhedrovirus]